MRDYVQQQKDCIEVKKKEEEDRRLEGNASSRFGVSTYPHTFYGETRRGGSDYSIRGLIAKHQSARSFGLQHSRK